jgi:hypothetical protein
VNASLYRNLQFDLLNDLAPITGLAPAPSPCWLIGNFLSAAQFSNVRQSVLIAAKGSPSVLIMRPAAQPMAIITSHPLWCGYPLLYEGSRFEVQSGF